MATKERCLVLKNDHQTSDHSNSDSQYQNINLNQFHNGSEVNNIQSESITNKSNPKLVNEVKHSDTFTNERKNNSWATKTHKPLEFNNFTDAEKVVEKHSKENKTTSTSNSTLSLHIAAYENSVEVADDAVHHSDENEEVSAKKSQNKALNKMQKCIKQLFSTNCPSATIFEIPRQQEDASNNTPEIMQFKASQKLLNPYDASDESKGTKKKEEYHHRNSFKSYNMSNIPATMQRREAISKRKVLLMGKSGAGKTSMRSIIFANYIARDCDRLGPTLEIEHAHVRFLGNMALHLWDCGGQETFMENYMTSQRDQIFKNVQVLIYVFDVESREIDKDYRNYQGCLEALLQNSPQATVFCLIHKMDLVSEENRNKVFQEKVEDVRRITNSTTERLHTSATIECHPSSIWDETLYKAWSAIVYHLVPNVTAMEQKLNQFADIIEADEILLFEKATFLVVAQVSKKEFTDHHRFEKVSNIIKQFKLSCSRMGAQFDSILVRNSEFSAFIDSFTNNTYIMSICDGNISTAAVSMNIKSARKHFEKLDAK